MAEGGSAYLPISDGMAKDLDSGKAVGRDVADFLPDAVAQELYDQSNPGPVHAENLIPISPQQAAEMRTIDPASGTLPKFPGTRRVIPAPFRRDRLVGGSHGKAWCLILADKIVRGDIITDIGLVVSVEEKVRYKSRGEVVEGETGERIGLPGLTMAPLVNDIQVAVGRDYVVTGAGGNQRTFGSHEQVKVFRRTN